MAYSNDLRFRVIHVVEGGAAARAAARKFAIGDSTAIRWAKRWRETGSFEAKSNKGQSRSPLKHYEEWLLDLVRREPDLTLGEIQGRLVWADNQAKLDSECLVFIDETGTSTNMARLRGRATRGKRLVGKVPQGHWKTTTFVAALRSTALTAPGVIDGPMNGNAFVVH
jgi:transposase-like protein